LYRKRRGLSQERFADVLEFHRTYMGGIERGERNLTLRSVERIAERVGLDPLDLLRPANGGGATNGGEPPRPATS
jgi:transcriptional regulator with XRE-family HTH domain